MSPHPDPEAAFAAARPDEPPPGTAIDVKRAVREGRRTRRRRRAAIGGAGATGVCAVAAVLVLSVAGPPAEDPERREFPAGEGFAFDPAQAAYPGDGAAYDWAVPQPTLQEAANEVFGALATEAGFLDEGALDYETPSDADVQDAMDEQDLDYYGALAELGYRDLPLRFGPWTAPVDAGRSHLRGYTAADGDEEAERPSFTVTALQPGGWTAEPGPRGAAAFPQHLIGDGPSWTEEAPELSTEDLEDGRTVTVADHGCALEAAVVYPNGTALTSAWDLDCEGQGREMTADRLREAMLAMPQIEYDTGELAPVGDLLEVPPGWAYDEAWETEAAGDAQASVDAATAALDAAHPGVELLASQPAQLDTGDGRVRRTYAADYYMPFDDAEGNPVHSTVRYYLPGGWLPGLTPEGSDDEAHLVDCGGEKDDACEETEAGGRTVATRTFGVGDTASTWVVVYDQAGWAVEFATTAAGDLEGYALDDLVELALSLPAPVYDPEAYDR